MNGNRTQIQQTTGKLITQFSNKQQPKNSNNRNNLHDFYEC